MRITESKLRSLIRKALLSENGKTLGVPHYQQETNASCGAAVIRQILLKFGHDMPEIAIRAQLGTSSATGTYHEELESWFNSSGWLKAKCARLTVDQLFKCVDADMPVILDLQAYSDSGKKDYSGSYEDGHYVVLNGYDDKNFYFSDTATTAAQTYLPIEDLQNRWHVKTSKSEIIHNLGIVVWKVCEPPPPGQKLPTFPKAENTVGAKAKKLK